MAQFIAGAVIVVLLAAAYFGFLGETVRHAVFDESEATKQQRLLNELKEADAKTAARHREARSAMNDAADQSWRNLAD